MTKNNLGLRFACFLIITLLMQGLLVAGASADEKSNFISDKAARDFKGVWKVRKRGSNLFGSSEVSAIWVIRKKDKKLIIEIPEADLFFDDIKIDGRKLSQTIMTEDDANNSQKEDSIDIEVVDGLFDGVLIDKDSRVIVTGRLEPLYNSARKAEEVFDRKLDAEKKRLGEGIKKLAQYEKQIADYKNKLKNLGSKKDWEKERDQDLRSLQRRNDKKIKSLISKNNKKIGSLISKNKVTVNQLKNDLNRELRNPPRVNVSRLPRDAQAYKTTDLRAKPLRDARSYFKVRKNQSLIRMANLDNGWSLVATDRGDMGFVITTHLRAISGSAPPISSSSSNDRNERSEPAETKEDKSPQLIKLVAPRRGKGSRKHNILIPAAGFVTLRGNLVGSKVKLFTINGENVDVVSGNSFRHLIDITQDGQIIKFFAITSDGQQRLDLRTMIAF